MQLCIRAHDLSVTGTEDILARITQLGIDGVQMVCYKAYPQIPYAPGGITPGLAAQIGNDFAQAGKTIPLIGAYFNPVHSSQEKRELGFSVFANYLRVASQMGSGVVASETGSYNDEPWIYHPQNRTRQAQQAVAATFSLLCDIGQDFDVNVAMEGAAGHVCWCPEVLDKTQRMMDRPNLKVIFDLFNYLDAGNQGDYMAILDRGLDLFAGRIHAFHMKDCRFRNGKEPAQVPFGTGEMEIPAILKRIKKYDPNAVLVLEGTTGDAIPAAVEKIKSIWECI